jgi:hypothetical protein
VKLANIYFRTFCHTVSHPEGKTYNVENVVLPVIFMVQNVDCDAEGKIWTDGVSERGVGNSWTQDGEVG